MKTKFYCFDYTLAVIEGRAYSEDPRPTFCGIEQAEYDEYREAQGQGKKHISTISDLEAKIIFDRNYWTRHRCEEMGWPLNFVFFQYLLNLTTAAMDDLQRLVGIEPTQHIGNKTINEVRKNEPEQLAQRLLDAQRAHYKSKPGNAKNLEGLLNRCDKVAKFCDLT